MSIAVFTDDRELFDSAVARYKPLLPAYIYGTEDGDVPKVIDASYFDTRAKIDKHWYGQTVLFDGLCQETGRDFTHSQWGIGGLIHFAEIAWHQGIDLYSENDNRLLQPRRPGIRRRRLRPRHRRAVRRSGAKSGAVSAGLAGTGNDRR
jgi:hypothetical protein